MKKIHWTNCSHPFKYINVIRVDKGENIIGKHPIKVIHLKCIKCNKHFKRSPILKGTG